MLWARSVTILEAVDPTPPANARALFDAVIYLVITDTSWDALPPVYPAPNEVFLAVTRWKNLGVFTKLCDALPVLLTK
jgi:hypothetical protein